ncbi:MAG TPA: 50S ribosomal protein L6 [Candidatus Paceibacterota bacterium]|nr:50S ribosomal protein L6 [Candidatus Paceibacterota bacterium]
MSRLTKKSIPIPKEATLTASGEVLTIKGPKGELTLTIPKGVTAKIEGDAFSVTGDGAGETMALQGTLWALTRNAIEGVTAGFTKVLEIEGVGYRVATEGKELVLYLGYALPVRMPIPANVTIAVDKNVITVTGIDKDAVGQAAAEIRAQKKPEPYKGKGIHYQGEVIRRKVGKKAGATAA